MRRLSVIVCAVLVAGGMSATVGQGSALATGSAANWAAVQPVKVPPASAAAGAVTAFDPATGQLLLTTVSNGTWSWDGLSWNQLALGSGSHARSNGAMAFDGTTKQMVMLVPQLPPASAQTWTWNGLVWSQQLSPHSPISADCIGYDDATKQLVALGLDDTTSASTSTFLWQGGDWSTLPPSPTAPLTTEPLECSMAYDPALDELVAAVHSPIDVSAQLLSWDGQRWNTLLSSVPWLAGGPVDIAYDDAAGQLLALAAVNTTGATGPNQYIWPTIQPQAWAMTGESWSQLTLTAADGEPAGLSYDAATDQAIGIGPSGSAFNTLLYEGSASSSVLPLRLAGANRDATAVAISQNAFPDAGSAGAVVLARSDGFADALAGGPLAAAKHGPLLLTSSDSLDGMTKAEIQRVLPVGGTVYVLGSTTALSAKVSAAMTAIGDVPVRLAGPDRFGTAIAVANALGNPSTVFEVNGLDFPDALSAVPAAVSTGGVVLLTHGPAQAKATATYLSAHPGSHYAVGGLAAAADPSAIALAGANRYATSDQVASAFFPKSNGVTAASGLGFADALAAGPVAGAALQPLLLVPTSGPLPEPIIAYLGTRDATVTSITVAGGTASVTDDVEQQIAAGLN
ncbi:MAG: cell wall-binding repeat-containing protein [Acidothermaceae bacterium]